MRKLLVIFALFFFPSCGKQKTNKVILDREVPVHSDISKKIENSIKAGYSCPSGESRLSPYPGKIENPIERTNYTKVRGAITKGHLPRDGKETTVYTGTNINGDLFFVTKLYDGNGNVGYNLTLSLCTDGGLVTRPPTDIDWYANYGMVLSATGSCGKVVSKLLVTFPDRVVSDWNGNSQSVAHREILEFYNVDKCP